MNPISNATYNISYYYGTNFPIFNFAVDRTITTFPFTVNETSAPSAVQYYRIPNSPKFLTAALEGFNSGEKGIALIGPEEWYLHLHLT